MEEQKEHTRKGSSHKKRRRLMVRLAIFIILVFALIGFVTVIFLIVNGIFRLVGNDKGSAAYVPAIERPVTADEEPGSAASSSAAPSSISPSSAAPKDTPSSGGDDSHLTINLAMLTRNPYSRPGSSLSKVNSVVIHYTASPGGTAMQNREYFEDLRIFKTTKASSHFIVGLEGEVVQCIPTREIAYASNNRNNDSIAIECCHEDESGKFNSRTLDSMKKLTAWLLVKNGLSANDETIIRHYDVSGKLCPKYFVEHEDEWEKFKKSVADYIDENLDALKSEDYLLFTE